MNCSVANCHKPAHRTGLCSGHYGRLVKHGDVMEAIPLGNRGTLSWIKEMSKYDSNECLIWPFSRSEAGYGRTSVRGRSTYAHRVMCEIAHGKPPTPDLDAAHTCGNGFGGCVNPRHLQWKTRKENIHDQFTHGTFARGARQWKSKLTECDVREILSMRKSRSTLETAKKYGVSYQAIYGITSRRNWAWVEVDD